MFSIGKVDELSMFLTAALYGGGGASFCIVHHPCGSDVKYG